MTRDANNKMHFRILRINCDIERLIFVYVFCGSPVFRCMRLYFEIVNFRFSRDTPKSNQDIIAFMRDFIRAKSIK